MRTEKAPPSGGAFSFIGCSALLGTTAVISDVQVNVDCQQRTAGAATDINV
jgi:hypothetical protein